MPYDGSTAQKLTIENPPAPLVGNWVQDQWLLVCTAWLWRGFVALPSQRLLPLPLLMFQTMGGVQIVLPMCLDGQRDRCAAVHDTPKRRRACKSR